MELRSLRAKKQLKEEALAAALAKQDMWDKVPLFQHPSKPKAKKLFAQLEAMLEQSLKSKDFKEAEFLKFIVDEHLCET